MKVKWTSDRIMQYARRVTRLWAN